MSYPPLHFAIVGCGVIASTHAQALAALSTDDANLTACCDLVPDRMNQFAETYGIRALGFEDILADSSIGALTICTPSGLHAALGVRALLAGKHVIIEKPMDVTQEACDQLIAAQQQSGKTLAVISQHRFDAASQTVKALLDNGDLGDLILVDARIPWYRTQEYYDSGDWRGSWMLDGGGCLMNQGVHTVDLVRWLCGPLSKVYAQARTAAHQRIETEDVLCATLTFANGAIGTLMATTAAYPGFPVRIAVHGTKGSAIIEGDVLQTVAIYGQETITGQSPLEHAIHVASGGTKSATIQKTLAGTAADPAAVWGEAHRMQLADFVRCCRTGERPIVDGPEGRNAVELVLAIYASARSGQPVTLVGSV